MTGTIDVLVLDRGFGFLVADDGQRYFFHRSTLPNGADFSSLQIGQAVSFDSEQSPKGLRAGNLALL